MSVWLDCVADARNISQVTVGNDSEGGHDFCSCAGFRMPGSREPPHDEVAGVRKAPRHEVAGSWAPARQRALWRFNAGADVDDGRDAGTTPAAYLHVGVVGRVQQAFWLVFGADQAAIRALIDVIGPREIAAGVGPAHWNGKAATLTEGPSHDVSILISVGRQLGWQPGAKVSMTIMRAPQHGHGYGSTRGVC